MCVLGGGEGRDRLIKGTREIDWGEREGGRGGSRCNEHNIISLWPIFQCVTEFYFQIPRFIKILLLASLWA